MPVWQSAPLLMHTWADETVVFQKESGDTHLVDGLVAGALLCLQEGELDEADLAARLGVQTGTDFTAMLGQLAASGLIVCRAC